MGMSVTMVTSSLFWNTLIFAITKQVLQFGRSYFLKVSIDSFKTAKLLEQLGCCLITDAGDARDIV